MMTDAYGSDIFRYINLKRDLLSVWLGNGRTDWKYQILN